MGTNPFRVFLVSLCPTYSQNMGSNGVRQLRMFPREMKMTLICWIKWTKDQKKNLFENVIWYRSEIVHWLEKLGKFCEDNMFFVTSNLIKFRFGGIFVWNTCFRKNTKNFPFFWFDKENSIWCLLHWNRNIWTKHCRLKQNSFVQIVRKDIYFKRKRQNSDNLYRKGMWK